MATRALRVLLVLVLAWVLPAGPATAAAAPLARDVAWLVVSPTSAIVGEHLRFTGTVPASRARTVVLQVKMSDGWRAILRGTTTRTGRFTFKVGSRSGTTAYRVRARATSTEAAVATIPRKVITIQQEADLQLPGGAHVGQTRTAWAAFSPARSSRPVELQVLQGDAWVAVDTQLESGNGQVTFPMPTDRAGTFAYRAVATVFHGAEPAVSPIRSFVVEP